MDLLRRFSDWQHRTPLAPLGLGLLITLLAAGQARHLELQTGFEQLLPEHQPSVIELRRLQERTAGLSHVYVVLEGKETARLRAAADALVPRLRQLGPELVGSAESGVQEGRRFLLARAGLFAKRPALQTLREEVEARFQEAVARQGGALLDDEAAPLPPLTAERVRQILDVQASPEAERLPGGYYQAKDGTAIVVVVGSPVTAGENGKAREVVRRVRAVVDEARAQGLLEGVAADLAGDLVTGLYEYQAILDDLVRVGGTGVGLVLLVVLLFFGRLRSLLGLFLAIGTGLSWTFGAAFLFVGHLNVASGFLVSIIAGNGINFGIVWMGRYLEERRGGATAAQALLTAHQTTWAPTLVVALAAAASYGALAVTDFRGFRDFAAIGAAGMVLCWLSTMLVLPPGLLLLERRWPVGAKVSGPLQRLREQGGRFEVPFVWAVQAAPRLWVWGGIACALFGAAAGLVYLARDPLEYDMRKLQSRVQASGELYRVSARAAEVLGSGLEGAMVLLCETPEQAEPLRAALEARKAAAPRDAPPFQAVHDLQEMVAPEQESKVPLLLAIRERLLRARALHAISDHDWAELEPLLPPAGLLPYTLADLPADLARPLTEKDGRRGRLLVIEPTLGKSDNDLRYLLRWADSFRETRLPDGSVVRGSGRAVIFADMLAAVVADAPRALLVAGLLVALWVVLAFGLRRAAFEVLVTLGCGLLWLFGLLAVGGVRIHFLNFMALPITLGVGVDYAVNLIARQRQEHDALRALRTVGGPVALCSLTTILGYLALLGSINQGVRSLGLVAVLGEICCLLAALLVLPAWLLRKGHSA